MLRLEGLKVEAGGVMLLEGLDLELRRGEMVALCGPSGCGKTTLLRVVAGLADAAGGRVLQHPSGDDGDWPGFRRRVVLVQQRPVLLPGSVRDNLRRPFGYRSGGGAAFPEREASTLLETFGVSRSRMDQEASSLSQGQQQRICLVRGLMLEPEVLLLDEPTSALDRTAVTSVESTLRSETRRRGLSALVVTHDEAQAGRLCGRRVDLERYMAGDGVAAG